MDKVKLRLSAYQGYHSGRATPAGYGAVADSVRHASAGSGGWNIGYAQTQFPPDRILFSRGSIPLVVRAVRDLLVT